MLWYDQKARDDEKRIAGWLKPAVEAEKKPEAWQPLPPEAVAELQRNIVGQVVLPSEGKEYEADRKLANPRFNAFPQVIVYCDSFGDVRECLQVARQFNLWVTTRSGGHSTAGFSANDGMLIDISRLNDVFVDKALLRAWAGPGCNFRRFNQDLEFHDVHTPGGACPDVCTAGYMQGGGYGFTARIFGMHCDQVEAVWVMLADGSLVYADATMNADLFWAVRGGTGNNFGVLLQTKYRLYQGSKFCGFSIIWPMDTDAGRDNAAKALAWLQAKFMRTGAPPELGYQMIWAFEGPTPDQRKPYVLMRGMYRGDLASLKRVLTPVLKLPGAELQYLLDQQPYSKLNKTLLTTPYEVPQFPPNTEPMPPPEAKTSRYLASPLKAVDWRGLIDYFLTSPSPYTIVAMEIYGGAIAKRTPLETAFVHRAVDCDVFFDVFWFNPREEKVMLAYIEGWKQKIEPYWNGLIYQNYPSIEAPDYSSNYWGPAYPALRKIKYKYDPNNFFRFAQSIVPAAAGEPMPEAMPEGPAAAALAQAIVHDHGADGGGSG